MAEPKKVTRIKATDDSPKKTAKSAKATETKVVKARKTSAKTEVISVDGTEKKNVFARIGGYFKGAWVELRQVRWPNRRATWALTLAVILFSVFFGVLISLLDTLFKYLFELIIA